MLAQVSGVRKIKRLMLIATASVSEPSPTTISIVNILNYAAMLTAPTMIDVVLIHLPSMEAGRGLSGDVSDEKYLTIVRALFSPSLATILRRRAT
jgi:hypothetical protein